MAATRDVGEEDAAAVAAAPAGSRAATVTTEVVPAAEEADHHARALPIGCILAALVVAAACAVKAPSDARTEFTTHMLWGMTLGFVDIRPRMEKRVYGVQYKFSVKLKDADIEGSLRDDLVQNFERQFKCDEAWRHKTTTLQLLDPTTGNEIAPETQEGDERNMVAKFTIHFLDKAAAEACKERIHTVEQQMRPTTSVRQEMTRDFASQESIPSPEYDDQDNEEPSYVLE